MYILPPVTTPVTVTLPEDTTSNVEITLPPITLPLTFTVAGSKESITDILPDVTLPRVYILLPLTMPVAITLP